MYIEDNRNVKKIKFLELKAGEVFIYNDNYFIRINANFLGMNVAFELSSGIAVELSSGRALHFENNPEVEKVDAKIVIKG